MIPSVSMPSPTATTATDARRSTDIGAIYRNAGATSSMMRS